MDEMFVKAFYRRLNLKYSLEGALAEGATHWRLIHARLRLVILTLDRDRCDLNSVSVATVELTR